MKQFLHNLKITVFGVLFFGGIIYTAFFLNNKDDKAILIKDKMRKNDIIILVHKDKTIDTIIN